MPTGRDALREARQRSLSRDVQARKLISPQEVRRERPAPAANPAQTMNRPPHPAPMRPPDPLAALSGWIQTLPIDSEQLMILLLLFLLYKNDCDKRLILALLYIIL